MRVNLSGRNKMLSIPLPACACTYIQDTALVGGFFSSHAHDMMAFLKRLGGAQARRLPAKPGTDGRTSVPEPRGQEQKKKAASEL